MKKLAIITTHPIQYNAPVFQLLAQQTKIKVFYTGGHQTLNKFDHGFKKNIEWDIPLLNGYDYEFIENVAKDKGSHHFKGIKNPTAIDQIKSYQPDAILVYGWAYTSHLKILRYFKDKIPVYFRGDSHLLNYKFSWKNALKKLLLTWVYQHVDAAFYVGTANKAYFKKYGLKEHQLIFAPHAIDNDRFGHPKKEEVFELRKQLNIGPTNLLILFAGKLEEVKNPEILLKAFKTLKQEHLHLVFVGNGLLEKKLKEESEHMKERVHFLGFQNQTKMPTIYQAADLLCLPSKSETWGLAVNEAMAAGKPVLVSDKVGCYLDLVTKTSGSVFKNEDLEDLTQKLIALTKDKSLLENMGENALNHIQNWSFEQQVSVISRYVNR